MQIAGSVVTVPTTTTSSVVPFVGEAARAISGIWCSVVGGFIVAVVTSLMDF